VDVERQAETIRPKINNEKEQSRNLFFIFPPVLMTLRWFSFQRAGNVGIEASFYIIL
jgi:hypothetical protein